MDKFEFKIERSTNLCDPPVSPKLSSRPVARVSYNTALKQTVDFQSLLKGKDGFPDITLYYGGGLRKVRAEGSLQDLGVVPSNHLKSPLPLFALVIVSLVTKPYGQ